MADTQTALQKTLSDTIQDLIQDPYSEKFLNLEKQFLLETYGMCDSTEENIKRLERVKRLKNAPLTQDQYNLLLNNAFGFDKLDTAQYLIDNYNAKLSDPLYLGSISSDFSLPAWISCLTTPFNTARANFLLKNKVPQTLPQKYFFTVLQAAIGSKNMSAIEFYCNNNLDINAKGNMEDSPVEYAIGINYLEGAKKLIAHGALSICFDLQKKLITYPEGLKCFQFYLETLEKKLTDNDSIKKLTLGAIKLIPFTSIKLDAQTLNAIEAKIKSLINASNLSPKIKSLLVQYLDNDKVRPSRFKKISHLNVTAELADVLCNPDLIDQDETNLCGPASFYSCLAKNTPEIFVDLAIQLATNGITTAPLALNLSDYSKSNANSILTVLMVELRRSENLTGYNPDSVTELFQGVTNPRLIQKWLTSCGYQNVQDNTDIRTSSGNTLPKTMMWLLDAHFKKFHANNHTPLSNDANLALIQKQLQENKNVIMLISPQFEHKIETMQFSKHYIDANVNAIFTRKTSDDSLLGFSIDHYINLHKLEIIDDSTVNLEYSTYGKKYSATITRAELLAGFRGAILATSPLYQAPDKSASSTKAEMSNSAAF